MRKIIFAAALTGIAFGTSYASGSALKDLQSSAPAAAAGNSPRLPLSAARQDAATPSFDAINSAIVDMLFATHQVKLSPEELKKIPAEIVCKDDSDVSASSFMSDKDNGSLVANWSDGDQVGGLYLLRADLENLAAKKTDSIPAKSISGFWWSDGDHYGMTDTACRLK